MNQIDFEKLAIPTVTIVTDPFIKDATSSGFSFGLSDIALVTVAHPIGGITADAARAKADAAFQDILKTATEWEPPLTPLPTIEPHYPAKRFDYTGLYTEVNRFFFEKGWSMGLPIVPPIAELVSQMLTGTSHRGDEILWEVPPRGGILTVELVAVHAVMAGCKPEYMPLLLAVIDGLRSDQMNWRSAATTTHPNSPLVIINGPVIKELKIAFGTGAASGWFHPNVSIGYAMNLMCDIVGGAKPPDVDKTTLGYSGNMIATVIGENEDANPWEPYHMERGFKKTDSVITVTVGGPPVNWQDHSSPTIEQVMRIAADTVNYTGQNGSCYRIPDAGWGGDVFLILGEEFASLLKKDGWTKDSIRKFIFENGRHSIAQLQTDCMKFAEKRLEGQVREETLVPACSRPEQIQIIVAGGMGKHGQYWPTCPGGPDHPVMVEIDPWR
ncbi:MAG: hypothetical protein A2169_11555 [Deltaproteobacteria bacterium RBG_13_47_9]|nr:MAG: hypothetical protein A2169_11555 [Deltaproteobacteria bacterium RBG_13_47_9]